MQANVLYLNYSCTSPSHLFKNEAKQEKILCEVDENTLGNMTKILNKIEEKYNIK